MKRTIIHKKKYPVALALGFIAILLVVSVVSAAAGSLDPGFDEDGLVTTTFANPSYFDAKAFGMTALPDGKLIAVGAANHGSAYRDFALVRYNSDGSLDTSFNTNGQVTTDFSNGAATNDEAHSVAIQSDEKIVVAGDTTTNGGDYQFALARYNSDGSLDTTFSTDGKVLIDLNSAYDGANAVAIQSDGKIVAVGSSYTGGTTDMIAVLRYNSDGTLDPTFDTDGILITPIGTDAFGNSLAIQADGKILVAGTEYSNSSWGLFLVRYNSDGSLDTSFDSDGIVTIDFNNQERDEGGFVAIQSDGKILLAGSYAVAGSGYFSLARYTSDGSLDTSFGINGKAAVLIGDTYTTLTGIALQSNGNIVVAGYTGSSNGVPRNDDFALARFRNNGSLDTGFGNNGKISTDFGVNQDDIGYSVVIQPDNNIVIAGYRMWEAPDLSVNHGFALARYTGEPLVPNTPSPVTIILSSVAAQDGWVLETAENSNAGGKLNSVASTFSLGDDAGKRQYRGVLSFNTGASIPDDAIIIKVTLKVKKQGIIGGGNPVAIFKGFMADIKNGFFGIAALQSADFKTLGSTTVGPTTGTLTGSTYNINLTSGQAAINKFATNSGLTQIRLRFKVDDNNNAIANILNLYSSNAKLAADRPQLLIMYSVP